MPELAPGLIGAGLGSVPVAQTFLDIGQGNRVDEDLYDGDLPRLYVRDGRVPRPLWDRTVARADNAPANIVPGLLASTLAGAGIPVVAEDASGLATLIGVDRGGAVRVASASACAAGCGPGLSVLRARLGELRPLVDSLGPDDLLIVFAAGARAQQQLLPAGIAGEGFDGNLTSTSTRTDGVVISTDVAPTVLEHLGVEVPDEVNGSEITSGDRRDPGEVADLQARLDHRPSRDTAVVLPLAIWIALVGLAALLWRRRGARPALRLLALAVAWTPLVLLGLAIPDAGPTASALAVGIGAPLLALATDRLLAPVAGLALACGATVGAYAVDVVAGSAADRLLRARPEPGRRRAVLRDRQRARGDPHGAHPDRGRRLARASSSARARAAPGGAVVPRHRPGGDRGVRARALRRRRRRRDRARGRRGDRGGDRARPPARQGGARRRRMRGTGARGSAGGGSGARRSAPEPVGARCGRGGRSVRRPRQAPDPDGQHLRRSGLPGAARGLRRAAGRRARLAPAGRRLVRRPLAGACRMARRPDRGTGGDGRQRFRLRPLGDRHDLPRGLRGLFLGHPRTGASRIRPSYHRSRARSNSHPVFVDISGGRQPARRRARPRADRPRSRAPRARPRRSPRPPQPGASPWRAGAGRGALLRPAAGADEGVRGQRVDLEHRRVPRRGDRDASRAAPLRARCRSRARAACRPAELGRVLVPRGAGGRDVSRLLDQAAAQSRRHARRRAPQVQSARRPDRGLRGGGVDGPALVRRPLRDRRQRRRCRGIPARPEAGRRRAPPGVRRPARGAQGPPGSADGVRGADRARGCPADRDRRRSRRRRPLPLRPGRGRADRGARTDRRGGAVAAPARGRPALRSLARGRELRHGAHRGVRGRHPGARVEHRGLRRRDHRGPRRDPDPARGPAAARRGAAGAEPRARAPRAHGRGGARVRAALRLAAGRGGGRGHL